MMLGLKLVHGGWTETAAGKVTEQFGKFIVADEMPTDLDDCEVQTVSVQLVAEVSEPEVQCNVGSFAPL